MVFFKMNFNLHFKLVLYFCFNFKEDRVNAENRVEHLRQSIKNEIDARVQVLTNELKQRRNELFNEVDEICEDALK